MSEFAGLLLTLKKEESNIKTGDKSAYLYSIMGYYNGLDIHTIDKWYDFSPRGLADRNLQIDLSSSFVDQYTIRVLLPEDRDELDKQGLAYGFWEELGRHEDYEPDNFTSVDENQYPYICMATLNLSESFVGKCHIFVELQKEIISVLKKSIERAGHNFDNIKCAIFPAIGFTDYVVLFLVDDLYKASDILKQMCIEISEDDNKPVISKCHAFYGADVCYDDSECEKWMQELLHSDSNELYEKRDLHLYEDVFSRFRGKYDSFLRGNNIQIRSSKSIQRLMRNFLHISGTPHGFDVEHILGAAFRSVIEGMEYYVDKACGPTVRDEVSLEEIKDEQLLAVEAVDLFNESIGAFVWDLVRAERSFTEGNILTHSVVGSATKLLMAYNLMLEKLNESFGATDDFTFIVTSGGCDRTASVELYSFVSVQEKDDLKKAVIITIPEMSLYDVQGTLFRILHEYMHFIGDRKRRKRYSCFINALAGMIAREITEIEFNDKRLDELVQRAGGTMSGGGVDEISDSIIAAYAKAQKRTKTKIQDAIENLKEYVEYGEHVEEEFYHKSVLKSKVVNLQNFAELLCANDERYAEIDKNNLQKQIHDILYQADKDLIDSICKILEEKYLKEKATDTIGVKRIMQSLHTYRMLQQNYEFNNAHSPKFDAITWKFVQDCMNHLLENFSLTDNRQVGMFFTYHDLVEVILFPMVECFSDCSAVAILGMKVEDFLFSFIYELWDMDRAFPSKLADCLRIGADLKVCYNLTSELGEETKRKVRKKAEARKTQGYEYCNVEEMLELIDGILAAYQKPEYMDIRQALESYLEMCMGDGIQWKRQDLSELYNQAEFENSNQIYKVASEIFDYWASMALGGKKDESRRYTV